MTNRTRETADLGRPSIAEVGANHARYEVKVLRTLEAMEELREVWSPEDPESDIDFCSFIMNIRPEIIRPHIIVVYRDGTPVSVLAGRLENSHFEIKIGYKVVGRANVRRLIVFYGGFIGQSSPEVSEIIVRQLLRSLRDEKADLFVWPGIRRDGGLQRLISRTPSFLCRDYLARPVRRWKMTLPASADELVEQRMSKKHRYWMKRNMRALDKDFPGAVRHVCFSTPDQCERLFADVIEVARKTYQWGLGVGFQDNTEQRERLRLEAQKGWLRGYVLYLQDKPAAFWICSVYQGTVHSAFTGFDPQYRKYEIGTALFLRMIGDLCREKNATQFDFGHGTALYKERFGDSSFEESTMCVWAFSLRGIAMNGLRLVTEGPLQLVRDALQRCGLDQKLKKLWRTYLTPAPGAKEPSQAQA